MTKGGQFKTVTVAALVAVVWMASKACAAQCGSTAAGFEAWKAQFAGESEGKGCQRLNGRSRHGDEVFDCDHRG
jgi:glucose-6-phosphate isomerase